MVVEISAVDRTVSPLEKREGDPCDYKAGIARRRMRMQAHDRGCSLTVLVVSVIGKGLGGFLTLDGVFRDVFVWLPVLRGFVDVCCSVLSHRIRIHLKFST
jgi:hypothetical protein